VDSLYILGIDTSGKVGGTALVRDGQDLVGEYTLNVETTHSERLMPAVSRVITGAGLEKHEVGAIAVACGPGSFTGLRIGITTAKVLAYAWDIPLVGVGTLDALAWQARWCLLGGGDVLIMPVLNARRGEVYGQLYRLRGVAGGGNPVPLTEALAVSFENLLDIVEEYSDPVLALGDGVDANRELMEKRLGTRGLYPGTGQGLLRAGSVAACAASRLRRGEQDDPMSLVPRYIRKSEAEIRWQQRKPG